MILKFTKAGNISAKSFSSEKLIETNNIFTIRGKKTFLFQLRACKQEMQLNTSGADPGFDEGGFG